LQALDHVLSFHSHRCRWLLGSFIQSVSLKVYKAMCLTLSIAILLKVLKWQIS
jgi:hypothetical protein